jgi:hypothetical protein
VRSSKDAALQTVSRPGRCGRGKNASNAKVFHGISFSARQSYSPKAAGSFQKLSSLSVEQLWKPYQALPQCGFNLQMNARRTLVQGELLAQITVGDAQDDEVSSDFFATQRDTAIRRPEGELFTGPD